MASRSDSLVEVPFATATAESVSGREHLYEPAPAVDTDADDGCLGTCVESLPLWTDARLGAHLDEHLATWDGERDLWVFAYGSLLWKPEFEFSESRTARIFGYHRSLCLWSTVNRGTPSRPGLVLALDVGGCCEGLAYRIEARNVRGEFLRLWKREMTRGSYRPVWLSARTAQGRVEALAFVMNRSLPTYAGRLDDAEVARVLSQARGRCGSSADYLLRTIEALRLHKLADHRLARYCHLLEGLGQPA